VRRKRLFVISATEGSGAALQSEVGRFPSPPTGSKALSPSSVAPAGGFGPPPRACPLRCSPQWPSMVPHLGSDGSGTRQESNALLGTLAFTPGPPETYDDQW